MSRKQTEAAGEIFIISDEPYRRIIYDGITYPQVFPHYRNTVVVNSHAKDLALPGERIGYIAINPEYPERAELANGFTFCNRTLGFVNAPALMQPKVRGFMEQGGWIRKMFEAGIALKAQYGADNVFDLSLGNPVVEPPEEFRRELQRLAKDPIPGMHRYMPNAGYPETRRAVAGSLTAETGLIFTADEIVMTCGAAAAINVVLKTILNPGEEVIILSPYFVEYGYYVDNHGGVAVTVPTRQDFLLDLAAIEAAITPRTRALIINSPNNPTGVVYPASQLQALADLLSRKQAEAGGEIFIISDEPYRRKS